MLINRDNNILSANKRKFLILSNYGWCWNMGLWLREEGHEAVVCILDENYKEVGDGLVDKVDDYSEVLKGDDSKEWIIVADNVGMGRILDDLRSQGWKVWGGSKWADKLEKDREYARSVFEAAGLRTPTTVTVHSIDEAERYIRERRKRYVLKPHDNIVSVYIGDDEKGTDCLEILSYWRSLGLENQTIDIQDYIVGRNVDVELWFGNGIYLLPPNYTVETKKFMPDDLGATVGCMSSVVWISRKPSRTLKEVLIPFAEYVRRWKFSGPISLNIIVEESTSRLYILEATPRIGYNAYYCLKELLPLGFSDLILRCVNMENVTDDEEREVPVDTTRFSVGIEVSIPPSPFEVKDKNLMRRVYDTCKGVPIMVEGKNYPAKVHLCDVKKEKRTIVCAGTNGIVAEVISADADVVAAYNRCVETVKMLPIPNKQARLRDAIEDFQKYFPEWKRRLIVGDIDRLIVEEISPRLDNSLRRI